MQVLLDEPPRSSQSKQRDWKRAALTAEEAEAPPPFTMVDWKSWQCQALEEKSWKCMEEAAVVEQCNQQ